MVTINIQKDLFQVTLMSHKLPGLHSFVSLADTLLAGLLTGERLDKQTYTKLHDKDKKEKIMNRTDFVEHTYLLAMICKFL